MTVARVNDEDLLSHEEVRAIGFEPTDEGWRPRTCIYCGGDLRRPFVRWTGAGGRFDVDADCGPEFLRAIGTEIARAIKADLTTTTTEVGG